MVLIKNLLRSNINELNNRGGEMLYDLSNNTPLLNPSIGFNGFILSDQSNNITDINNLTVTNLYGTLQTGVQPNITSIGTLTSLTNTGNLVLSGHNGSTTGLTLGATLVTATGAELNYVDTTAGTIQASKAMVVDASRNITNLNNFGLTGAITSTDSTATTSNTTGALKLTGGIGISNITDATSSTNGGSLTTAGGVAIAKKLYVGTDTTTASVILSSNESGAIDPNAFDSMTQVSGTTPSNVYDSFYNVAFNSNRSYRNSTGNSIGNVSDGTVITSYASANGFSGATTANSDVPYTLNNGNILFSTRLNTTVGGLYAATLLLATQTALTSVLWVGETQATGGASIVSLAAKSLTNIVFLTNNSKMFYTTNGSTFIENTSKPSGLSYSSISGSVIVWVPSFNRFLVGLSSGSGIAYSSDGITWTNATTPSNTSRLWVYYNPILNKAFAYNTGNNTSLIVTSDGITWTNVSLPSLTGTTFGEFLNNTHTGLIAIYPNSSSSVDTLIYSTDGTTWNTKLITSTVSIPGNTWLMAKTNICVFNNNIAIWSILNSSFRTAITAQLVSSNPVFKLNYLSGYIANQSNSGYQWYSSSTDSSIGTKIMEIDTQLDISVPQLLNNITNSTSISTGSLIVTGGVGIAKDVYIGQIINVAGNSILTGSVGIGTTTPTKKVEINSTTGDCLRLTYNDSDGSATNYVDLLVTSSGDLTLTPSGNDINISSHNGSTTGLQLNGTLITTTAAELNYNDTTPGTVVASKAMIVDSSRDITNINNLTTSKGLFIKANVANNTVDYPLSITVTPNTSSANGLGTGIEFNSINSNASSFNSGYINYVSSNVIDNTETGYFSFQLVNTGVLNSVMSIDNTGDLICSNLLETSDIRVKENIQDTIPINSLNRILNIHVKTYNFIKDTKKVNHTGMIAQELKEIFPEVVNINKTNEYDDFHSVHYTGLIPHIINCIKELYKDIQSLK